MEAVGVSFETGFAVLAADGEFVGVELLQAGDEALPEFAVTGEGVGGLVPVVELSHDGNALRARGPCTETPAARTVARFGMGAEIAPSVRQNALVESLLLIFLGYSFFHTVASPLLPMVRGTGAADGVFPPIIGSIKN